MLHAKQAPPKQKRTSTDALPSLTWNARLSREIEEEISDVSLATFHMFDNEGAGTFRFRRRIPGGGCGCGQPSDIRLKRDIAQVGELDSGINLYRYRYLWSDTTYVGVMAQEVAEVVPEAVLRGADGYLRVDYARLGLRLQTWDQRLEIDDQLELGRLLDGMSAGFVPRKISANSIALRDRSKTSGPYARKQVRIQSLNLFGQHYRREL